MRKRNESGERDVKRKTILILGAGVMQIPAIRIAKRKGWKVIAADGNPKAVGIPEVDEFELVDLKDKEGLLERAAYHRSTEGLDGVFTAGTDFSASVAFVAEGLGLPGIPYETALDATDKSRMRKILTQKGVPCPSFTTLERADIEKIADSEWKFPLVVKPVDNMGARGVVLVRTMKELADTAEKAVNLSRSGKVIVEDFIDGPEFSLDALVYRGKVRICGIADRHIHFPPVFVELGHTMPSRAPKRVQEEVAAVFEAAVAALGIHTGAAKGDVFYSRKGPMIGEIAARLSGGYMSGWTYPYASGVEVTAGALEIAVGSDPGDLCAEREWTSAERAFISIPGTVAEILGTDEGMRMRGVRDVFCRIERGSVVKFPENNVEKCGNVISALENPDDAISAAENAVAEISVRLEPSDETTEAFIFGEGRIRHQAYTVSEKTAKELEEMPFWVEWDEVPCFEAGCFAVMEFSGIRTELRDWNKKTAEKGMAFVTRYAPAAARGGWKPDFVLGRSFWDVFIRCGAQGALWMLETLAECGTCNEARERLARWKDAVESYCS